MPPICRDPVRAHLTSGREIGPPRICFFSLRLSVVARLSPSPVAFVAARLVAARADRAALSRGSRPRSRASLARFTFVSFHCHALDAWLIEAWTGGRSGARCVGRFAFLRRPVASERAAREAETVSRPFFPPPLLPPRVCFVDDRRPCCGMDRPLGWAARVVGGERPLSPPPLCACRPLRCERVTVPMTYAHVFAGSDWCWSHCLRLCVRARAQCARMLRIGDPPYLCRRKQSPTAHSLGGHVLVLRDVADTERRASDWPRATPRWRAAVLSRVTSSPSAS